MSFPWYDVANLSFLGLNILCGILVFIKTKDPDQPWSEETFEKEEDLKPNSKRVSCDQALKLIETVHSVLRRVVSMNHESVPSFLDFLMRDTRRSFLDRQIYVPNEVLASISDLLTLAAQTVRLFGPDRQEYAKSVAKIRDDYALVVSKLRQSRCFQ